MCVRFYKGEAMENTLAWAEGELKDSCEARRGSHGGGPREREAACLIPVSR